MLISKKLMQLNKKYFIVLFFLFIFLLGIFIGLKFNFNKNYFLDTKNNKDLKTDYFNNKIFLQKDTLNLDQNPQINQFYKAKVSKVIDGDTIELSNGKRLRYIGINTPEIGEPFSILAKKENENLVLNKEVIIEFDVQIYDKYNRLLGYVWVNDILVNKELVKLGLAAIETIPPNIKYQNIILSAQKEAQNNCLNIWENLCKLSKEISKQKDANCIKISNIFANALGDDNKNKNGEWVEIKNNCNKTFNLNGFWIKDASAKNRYYFSNFYLDPFASVKIYSGCGKDDKNSLYWQCPEGKYAIWNNDGDEAFLYDNQNNLIDYYKY
jgi:endonuclease YncB( thermonuclease family)